MAADQDNPDAQFLVFMRFFLGDGVEKSAEEAAEWLLKARDNGSEDAAKLIREIACDDRGPEQETRGRSMKAWTWTPI